MNHKNYGFYFLIAITLSACNVRLKDREQSEPINDKVLVVDGEYALPVSQDKSQRQVLHYERLELKPGAVLITEGADVKLVIDELIADKGTIATFKKDQKAAVGTEGRRGGSLEMVIAKASGELTVEMRGENGGDGFKGAKPDEALRGPAGQRGKAAQWFGDDFGVRALEKAHDGDRGGAGLQGYAGGNGFRGGDSGTAVIRIADKTDFVLNMVKEPGRGGLGGLGGDGGEGGAGGAGGSDKPTNDAGPDFTDAKTGDKGRPGPQGATGNRGDDGVNEKSCTQIRYEAEKCE